MSGSRSLVCFRRAPTGLDRPSVRRFAGRLHAEVAEGRDFLCLITGDHELQRLNQEFLGHDCPTDVLSFPALNHSGSLGEIAISVDRARDQAARFGHSLELEVQVLMLHGLLHLLGMDHSTDRGRMARAEARWRRRLSLPTALIERVRA